MIRVTRDRQLYIHGHRMHHGTEGLGLVLLGIGLMIHDIRDARKWITDLWRDRLPV